VLQGVAGCCSVLPCVAVCCIGAVDALRSKLEDFARICEVLSAVAVCCSVLQCAAVCCSVLHGGVGQLHGVAWCCMALRGVALC
jgi:hypothetical protein